MADGGRVNLAYIEEVTWGTTPASALTKVAFATSENFGMDTATTLSNAIRGDYIKPQVVRTSVSGTGGFPFEVAYADGPLNDFIEGVFRSDWTAAKTTGAFTPTADNAANKYTRGAGSFVTDGFVVGQSVKVSGFANAVNNGYAVITALDATNMTVAGLDLADEVGSGDEIIKHSGSLYQGTTLKSYSIERQFADLTNTYIVQKGQRPSSMSLSAQTGQILTGQLAFTGKAPLAVATATAGSGAYSASAGASNEVMNGIDHVTGIYVGGDNAPGTTAVTYCVSQIDLNFGSPVRPIECLGTLGPAAIGGNSFEFTGSMRVYTDDASKALWDDYVNYTDKALWFRFVDTAGNAVLWYLPQVQFTASDGPNSGGPDSDVMQSINFTCEYNAAVGALAVVTRIAA